jgi:hypothetical protein
VEDARELRMLAEWYRAFCRGRALGSARGSPMDGRISNAKLTNGSSLLRKITTERDAR